MKLPDRLEFTEERHRQYLELHEMNLRCLTSLTVQVQTMEKRVKTLIVGTTLINLVFLAIIFGSIIS